MATLPNTRVCINYGWYLAPRGCTGSEALAYLPAYDDAVRNYYHRKGFVLLSRCNGSSAATANPAVIQPPTDEDVRGFLAELEARRADAIADLSAEEREVKEALKDDLLEPRERRIWRRKAKALAAAKAAVMRGDGIPTFAQAKAFFLREYRIRMGLAQNQDVRRSLALYAQEQELATTIALLEREGQPERVEEPVG